MKSTIFLDIDGVLHPEDAAEIVMEGQEWRVSGEGLFRWAPLLANLVADHDIDIVIHSTWRYSYRLHELQAYFPESLRSKIVAVTSGSGRYESIIDYVVRHGIEKFLVLDDAKLEFPEGWPNLVYCDGKTGISAEIVQQSVIDFMNRNVKALTL